MKNYVAKNVTKNMSKSEICFKFFRFHCFFSISHCVDITGVRPSSGVRFKDNSEQGEPQKETRTGTPGSRPSTGLLDGHLGRNT